jgi:hypothetical protein
MLVGKVTMMMSLRGMMLSVLVFTVLVMMSRLMMMVSRRVMVRCGQLVMLVRRMFRHGEISVVVNWTMQFRIGTESPACDGPLFA